jgi:ABC-type antimicrobial peptide transport system permease subunit
LRAVVFGIAPSDPVVLIGAVIAVLSIAAVASWLPARRSSRINPVDALRDG